MDGQYLYDIAYVATEQGTKITREYGRDIQLFFYLLSTLFLIHGRHKTRTAQREESGLTKQIIKSLNMVPIIWKGARYKTTGRSAPLDTLVIHGMGGNLSGTTSWFQNPFSLVSAHAGVGENEIHEYVKASDTAWATGVWSWNVRSYNLEIQNSPLTSAVLENAKWYLLTVVIPTHFADRRPDRSWILPHKQVKPTQCPKGIDIDSFVEDLGRRWDDMHREQVVINVPVKAEGKVHTAVKVRTAPNTTSQILRTMKKGDGFWYLGKVEGENIVVNNIGNNIWVHLEDGNYCWSGCVKLSN